MLYLYLINIMIIIIKRQLDIQTWMPSRSLYLFPLGMSWFLIKVLSKVFDTYQYIEFVIKIFRKNKRMDKQRGRRWKDDKELSFRDLKKGSGERRKLRFGFTVSEPVPHIPFFAWIGRSGPSGSNHLFISPVSTL